MRVITVFRHGLLVSCMISVAAADVVETRFQEWLRSRVEMQPDRE